MFKPGSFNVEVPVGYYTQILGLGSHPSEVVFTSSKGVYSQELFGCRVGPCFGEAWEGSFRGCQLAMLIDSSMICFPYLFVELGSCQDFLSPPHLFYLLLVPRPSVLYAYALPSSE